VVVGGGGGGGGGKVVVVLEVVVDEVVDDEVVDDEVVDEVVVVVEVSTQLELGADQSAEPTKGSWFGIEIVNSSVRVLKELSVSLSARILVLKVP
jgi:hypothetical protein